ncbi:hypothetical protein C8250_036820 [Streptomyces sp. So13.3]|uniref:hypothetical protein n=1 Tax=Streptomyces TaxID=1883 RepID=UPI0011070B20|nr:MULTISPECIES: hypothetical protein [Streptomyces]MCZ4103341.1 hypothetical protein [Streptomyces sp. H39-C1]QNA76692.1 hypothetical protein C8250_036820 [Streptomyces sp. So13.3]
MTTGSRLAAVTATVLLCAALATGCGDKGGGADGSATIPTPSGSQLAHLDKVVGDAESAANAAESDAASDAASDN